MKKTKPILIFILLYAALLSLTTINVNRITGDEGNHAAAGLLLYELANSWVSNIDQPFSELKSFAINHHAHYKSFAAFMTYSPLHYIFIALTYLMSGVSRFTTILPTIIESVILLFFGYKLSLLSYKDKKSAALSILLIAFNPLFFFYSTTVMLEIAATMFIVITVYCFSRYLIENENKYFYFTAIGMSLGVLTKPPMIIILPVLLLTFIWEKKLSLSWIKDNYIQVSKSVFLFILFLSPWLVLLLALEAEGLSGLDKWNFHLAEGFEKVPVEGFYFMDGTIRSYTQFSEVQNLVFYVSTIFYTWYLVPFFLLGMALLLKNNRRLNVIEKQSILIVILFMGLYSMIGGAQPRFMIYVLPFILIPTSRIMTMFLKDKKQPLILMILVIAAAQCGQFINATGSAFPVGDFDATSTYIIDDADGETSVISSQPRAQAFSLALLDNERKIYLFYIPKTESDMRAMLDGEYSDPEWQKFGISYPSVGYVVVHEEYPQMDDTEFITLDFMNKRDDFMLVETIPGEVPGTRTFVYKRHQFHSTLNL